MSGFKSRCVICRPISSSPRFGSASSDLEFGEAGESALTSAPCSVMYLRMIVVQLVDAYQ
jgi:hypothetical protein